MTIGNPNKASHYIPVQQPQASGQLCPSARCEEGAVLLGIVGEDGVIGYITPQVTIDSDFVREAHLGRMPEKRFRFSQMCVESNCLQWTGSRCGLIDRALEATQKANTVGAVAGVPPKCSIRPRCRWFAQVGLEACAVCPLVITEVEPDDLSPVSAVGTPP
jgi:hypothetical protein